VAFIGLWLQDRSSCPGTTGWAMAQQLSFFFCFLCSLCGMHTRYRSDTVHQEQAMTLAHEKD